MSRSVRASLGLAYGATAAFHGARAPPTPAPCTAPAALIGPPSFGHRREARPARPVAIVATAGTLATAESAGVHAPFRNRRQGDARRPAARECPAHPRRDAFTVTLIKWPLASLECLHTTRTGHCARRQRSAPLGTLRYPPGTRPPAWFFGRPAGQWLVGQHR